MIIKKMLLAFPVIFTLVLSLCCGFFALASDSVDMSSDGYKGDYTSVLDYYTLDDFMEYYNCTSDSSYIYISSELYYRSATNYFYLDSAFFYTNDSNITFSIDNSNGVYTLLPSSPLSFQSAWACFSFDTDTSSFNHSSFYDSFGSTYQTISGITKIEINPTSNSITAYSYSDTVNLCSRSCNISPAKYSCIDSNIKGVPSFSDGLNVDVSFNPDLSGSLDRIVEQNGVAAESNYFSMQISNNSSQALQFLFCIVPSGNPVTLSQSGDLSNGIDFSSAAAIYYFTCDEWIYSPIITSSTDMKNSKLEKIYNQSSSWHYLSGNSTYNRSFNWAQINIQKGVEYDAVVVAIPTDYDKASRCFYYSSMAHYLDVSDGAEVYRSTFSVDNPVAYDSSCTDFDNNANNGLLNKDVNNASATMDNETGEVEVKDVSASDILDNLSTWEPGVIEKNVELFSLDGVQYMFQQCQSVFSFFGYSLSFFPSWVWAIILTGLVSVVTIGIIKALK